MWRNYEIKQASGTTKKTKGSVIKTCKTYTIKINKSDKYEIDTKYFLKRAYKAFSRP